MRKLIVVLLTLVLVVIPCVAFAATGTTNKESDSISFPLEKGASGEYMIQIQQRLLDLGYISFRPTGKYGDMTVSAVREFQQMNGLSGDGMIGEATYDKIFKTNNNRAYGNDKIPRTVGKVLTKTPSEYGKLVEWSKIDSEFPLNTTVKCIDFNTLTEFSITRTGGKNHAEIQPATAADLATMKKCFGGDYTWEKRPMLIVINGEKIASSMFGYPNNDGDKTGCGATGSFCLYFLNSKSDFGGGLADDEHAQIIQSAATTQ